MGFTWRSWTKRVFSPEVDAARTQEELAKIRRRVGPPVLWLLGKTQSGKSSIIKGLTGRTDIEIGEGWKACTRTSRLYDFPNEDECLIRFLDTRGIGEPFYDPTEDLAFAESRAHGILVVMQVLDPAQEIIKKVLAQVRKQKPAWPVVLVQTTLHQAYPRAAHHPDPYCFDTSSVPDTVPDDLVRALRYQQSDFQGLFDRHVAIDFTHADDGYEPQFYGLDALWTALAGIFPAGYRAVLTSQPDLVAGLRDARFEAAFPHVVSYALLAGVAAMVPLPVANLSGVVAAQGKMMHSIASIYGQSLLPAVTALGASLGISFLPRMLARSFLAGIPGVGTAAAGIWTASSTYAIGCTLCRYCADASRGGAPTTAELGRMYQDELARGRERFNEYFSGKGDPRSDRPHETGDLPDAT
jgi:uncharacterized protein (DUF697 family)/predicted GTPase